MKVRREENQYEQLNKNNKSGKKKVGKGNENNNNKNNFIIIYASAKSVGNLFIILITKSISISPYLILEYKNLSCCIFSYSEVIYKQIGI